MKPVWKPTYPYGRWEWATDCGDYHIVYRDGCTPEVTRRKTARVALLDVAP